MRAFDDICVRPSFDGADRDATDNLRRSVVKGIIVATVVGAGIVVATGNVPNSLDAYVSSYRAGLVNMADTWTQKQRSLRPATCGLASMRQHSAVITPM